MNNLDEILNLYRQKGRDLQNPCEIKSGKEAMVYKVTLDGEDLALKVYKDPEQRAFQNNQIYLEGKYFRKPSERKAVLKKSKFGKSLTHKLWVKREFHLLQKAKKLGAIVPSVVDWTPDSILMEFIGGEQVAPRLIDVKLTREQAEKALGSVLKDIEILLKIGVIHGDLSPYNILWWNDKPYIIDLPQAIDIRNNPNKDELLKRDLANITSYFEKLKTQP